MQEGCGKDEGPLETCLWKCLGGHGVYTGLEMFNVGCNEPSSLSPLCTEIYTSHFISQNGTLFHQQMNEYFEQHSDSAYQPDVPFRL